MIDSLKKFSPSLGFSLLRSVGERHRFYADPDSNFRMDADLDPDHERHQKDADLLAEPPPSFAHVGKSDFFYLRSKQCQSTLVYPSRMFRIR